jgi:hypothetical protein
MPSAHAEFLRKHGFGRQLAAFGKAAFFDLLLQLLRDRVAQRPRRDFLEHATRRLLGDRVIIQV